MIARFAAALLALSLQTTSEVKSDDVVVIGKRPGRLSFSMKTDRKDGVVRCVLKQSSGDPLFDERMCQAIRLCGATARTTQAMQACLTPHVADYSKELRHRQEAAAAKGDDPAINVGDDRNDVPKKRP